MQTPCRTVQVFKAFETGSEIIPRMTNTRTMSRTAGGMTNAWRSEAHRGKARQDAEAGLPDGLHSATRMCDCSRSLRDSERDVHWGRLIFPVLPMSQLLLLTRGCDSLAMLKSRRRGEFLSTDGTCRCPSRRTPIPISLDRICERTVNSKPIGLPYQGQLQEHGDARIRDHQP